MQRITSNNRVRRRLFPAEDVTDEARVDNFANILQESIVRDKIEKTQKWNFDFENDVPLEGTYQWFPCNTTVDWIGVESEPECKENKEEFKENKEDTFLIIKKENEATPSSKDGEAIPSLRKRRKNVSESTDKGVVRRKINFE